MLLPTIISCFFFRFCFLTSHSLFNDAGIHLLCKSPVSSSLTFITNPLFLFLKRDFSFKETLAISRDFNNLLMCFRRSSRLEQSLQRDQQALERFKSTVEKGRPVDSFLLKMKWKLKTLHKLSGARRCYSWMKCRGMNHVNTTTEKTCAQPFTLPEFN